MIPEERSTLASPPAALLASRASGTNPPDDLLAVARLVERQVGSIDITGLMDLVREIMVREALKREVGNLTRAAQLLGVTRQAVQQLVRRLELGDWVESLRPVAERSMLPERSALPERSGSEVPRYSFIQATIARATVG